MITLISNQENENWYDEYMLLQAEKNGKIFYKI